MDGLREWTTTLAGIAIFGSICETIIPDGAFEKYIRLCIGLVMILALISPIYDLYRSGYEFDFSFQDNQNSYREYENMEKTQRDEVIRIYKYNLSKKIKERVLMEFSQAEFEVECYIEEEEEKFGTINRVDLIVDSIPLPETAKKLKTIIGEEFGVKKVLVKFLKESNLG